MFNWFEQHPGTASWVQFLGTVAGIWYAVRVVSWGERRQRDRTWDAALVYADQLTRMLSELRDACSAQKPDWIRRFPYAIDDLVAFGQSISLELLPPKNALTWVCGLRRVAVQAKGYLEQTLTEMQDKKHPDYSSAQISFNALFNEATSLRGKLLLVRVATKRTVWQRTRAILTLRRPFAPRVASPPS
jgi:hypothetical protein